MQSDHDNDHDDQGVSVLCCVVSYLHYRHVSPPQSSIVPARQRAKVIRSTHRGSYSDASHHIISHHSTSITSQYIHHITSHHSTYITSHHITSHHITVHPSHHITSHHSTSHHNTSITSQYITSQYITSQYITSQYITSQYITSQYSSLQFTTLHCICIHVLLIVSLALLEFHSPVALAVGSSRLLEGGDDAKLELGPQVAGGDEAG